MIGERRSVRVQLLMTLAEVKAIDDWAVAHRVRGRSEAVRCLIELGLKAAEDGAAAEPDGE